MLEKGQMAMGFTGRRFAVVSIGVLLLAAGVLALWWGTQGSGEAAENESAPAALEPLDGTSLVRVRLTERAAERLGLRTAAVRDGPGAGQTVVPYSAVLYDTSGETWVYTSPEPLAFVRAPIEVERIEGAVAFLSDGPPSGTPVVSVGAAELLGTEFEVDH